MSQTVQQIMTPNPTAMQPDQTVAEAAQHMRDEDIGDVLVTNEDGSLCGIVTDRDIVVRTIAAGQDPTKSRIGDLCSTSLLTASPGDSVDSVIRTMREKAIRRVPVVDGNKPVGIVSLGDLAINRDESSVLADISKAGATS